MEMLIENIDLILVALTVIIAAVVFARRGQMALLRELMLDVTASEDRYGLYERLPKLTKMLLSSKTVSKIAKKSEDEQASP